MNDDLGLDEVEKEKCESIGIILQVGKKGRYDEIFRDMLSNAISI